MKNAATKLVICILAAQFAGGPLFAQSLKTIRAQEAEEASLSREAAYTNSVCGTSIDARIDWRSVAGWPENKSIADACGDALSALEAVCRSGDGRSRAAKVSSFVCAGDGSGPQLRGGTLRFGASPGGGGFSETRSLLEGAL
jgi:hypothetical protein